MATAAAAEAVAAVLVISHVPEGEIVSAPRRAQRKFEVQRLLTVDPLGRWAAASAGQGKVRTPWSSSSAGGGVGPSELAGP